MKLIVTFAFYFLYWFICFLGTGADRKNLAGLRSYPDAVQKAVREHPVLGKAAPQEKSIIAILLANLLLFTVVFSVLGLALKNILDLNSFVTAFWFFLTLGEGLGGFDLVIIDLLWWRNTKRIRFSFLPEQSHYQDPTKHVSSFLRLFPLLSSFGFLFLLILDRLIPHQHRNADHVWIRRDDGAGCRVGIKISVLPHKFFCQMERKKRIGLES